MRTLPITVTCPCGGSGPLSVASTPVAGSGARPAAWSCPDCGQAYRTDGLDPSAVTRQLAVVKRMAWGGVLGVLVVVGALALVRPGILVIAPVLLAVYYYLVAPRYRRRLRAVYESLPEWRLSPGGTTAHTPREVRPQ